MKETTISVSEAARHLADCVERAHYDETTFVLVNNGVPMARLIPEPGRRCTGRDLAAALTQVSLAPEEARAWREDLRAARKTFRPPDDKWR